MVQICPELLGMLQDLGTSCFQHFVYKRGIIAKLSWEEHKTLEPMTTTTATGHTYYVQNKILDVLCKILKYIYLFGSGNR